MSNIRGRLAAVESLPQVLDAMLSSWQSGDLKLTTDQCRQLFRMMLRSGDKTALLVDDVFQRAPPVSVGGGLLDYEPTVRALADRNHWDADETVREFEKLLEESGLLVSPDDATSG